MNATAATVRQPVVEVLRACRGLGVSAGDAEAQAVALLGVGASPGELRAAGFGPSAPARPAVADAGRVQLSAGPALPVVMPVRVIRETRPRDRLLRNAGAAPRGRCPVCGRRRRCSCAGRWS